MTPWTRDASYPTAWRAPDPRLNAEPACHDTFIHLSPDCEVGNHRACYGDAWCEHMDEPVGCEDLCHRLDDPEDD